MSQMGLKGKDSVHKPMGTGRIKQSQSRLEGKPGTKPTLTSSPGRKLVLLLWTSVSQLKLR